MKLLILSSLFSIVICSTSFADENKCTSGKYRYQLLSGSVEKSAEICLGKINVISNSCQKDIKACVKKIKDSALPKEQIVSTAEGVGSPGFKNCKDFGGIPRFAEFKTNGDWTNIATCFFDNDKVFIDNDKLYEITQQ